MPVPRILIFDLDGTLIDTIDRDARFARRPIDQSGLDFAYD
jgi:phosphoglycolate phosphatase-like HAD superfamily hydrolase